MSSEDPSAQLNLVEFPFILWAFGGAAGLFGFLMIFQGEALVPGLLALGLGALLALVIAQVTTVSADRAAGRLTIHYRSLLRHTSKEFALWEIASAEIERSHGSSSSTYRVALALKTGEQVPLHGYYSSGRGDKERIARRINEFLGVESEATQAQGLFGAMGVTATASFVRLREGETAGIHWSVEKGSLGTAPVLRWETPDGQLSGGFLFLAQKLEGMSSSAGRGMLAAVSSLLFRQLLPLYGFPPEDLPGLPAARPLPLADPGLGTHFAALASDPDQAQRLLTPWVTRPLEDWASRNPLRQLQAVESGPPAQLSVLFSPRRVVLVTLSDGGEEVISELASLGVSLAREISTAMP